MSPDQLFSLANALALAAWLGLLLLPHVAVIRNVIAATVIPCLFAGAYVVILARFFDPGGFTKFSTLEGLASLQGSPWLLLAGWLHYLVYRSLGGAHSAQGRNRLFCHCPKPHSDVHGWASRASRFYHDPAAPPQTTEPLKQPLTWRPPMAL
jgi:hypothetical protein